MIGRIDVQYKVLDARANVKRGYFESIGFKRKITGVALVDSYTIDANLSAAQLRAAAALFANPLVEKSTVNRAQAPKKFDWAIETGYLPGVTDNIGNTARETIEDLLKRKFKAGQGVYSSQVVFLSGRLSKNDAAAIADSLYNPLIQRATIKSFKEFKKGRGMGVRVPRVTLVANSHATTVNLNVLDDELARIGKEGIPSADGTRRGPLALDLQSMKTIQEYFSKQKREPKDIELESIAQTWSEHCKHTIFANPIDDVPEGLYRSYIKAATKTIRAQKSKKDFCVSVFSDNSGAIVFDDDYLITHKIETHNSPSALDPFGGAITGIVGVNRDTIGFGLGAKPVINLYGFCLAEPGDKTELYRDKAMHEKMLSARRIMEGVIAGVNAGGNCSGIPTPQGFVLFDKRYRGKPLVFAGTVGLIPRRVKGKPSYVKRARAGDHVVMVGGRVGQDGIHGATFSSEAMDSGSPATAVQIGDPITQKKMSDAIVKEARDRGLYNSITDNGAGGLSCSVAEMARECGGCIVDLEKVPLKYPGLEPWKIWISESQERMTLAIAKKSWKAFHALMEERGVEATIIGRFTSSSKCVVKWKGKTLMDLDMDFLQEGWPRKQLTTELHPIAEQTASIPEEKNLAATIKAMLARPNIASFEFISKQYDHEVQASSVLKPLQGRGRVNADASVTRPLLNSPKGVVLSSGILPSYSELDPYAMAAGAIDTAIRSAVAAGADLDHLAILDNFCWCSSNDPTRLFELKEAVRSCYDHAVAYGTPFISGKDSMFNDFKGYDENGNSLEIAVPPTLLISAIGVVPDVLRTVSLDLKSGGDLVYLLGETHEELGGSEYNAMRARADGGVPQVDTARNKKLYRALTGAIRKGLVASAVGLGKGGLSVALMRTAMGGELGMDLSLRRVPGTCMTDTATLFSESHGRILVSVAPGNRRAFEKAIRGNAFVALGKVTRGKKVILRGGTNGKKKNVTVPLSEALAAYRAPFKNY